MCYDELSGFLGGFKAFEPDRCQNVDTFRASRRMRPALDVARVSDYRVAASIHPTAHAFRLSFFRTRRDARR
ncbi:hypothetical protein [Burkholderia sp. Z1]|uniref:hypothetical protein n=1 Tax=Burkholderia sp. Z1 TaxID=2759039 RepID=UPI001867B139|nr:hypothetical protein [Burkholderia sp. Z1]